MSCLNEVENLLNSGIEIEPEIQIDWCLAKGRLYSKSQGQDSALLYFGMADSIYKENRLDTMHARYALLLSNSAMPYMRPYGNQDSIGLGYLQRAAKLKRLYLQKIILT